jgi:hypothetical protein
MGNHKLLNHTFCFKKCVDLFLILKAALKKEDINILILGETGLMELPIMPSMVPSKMPWMLLNSLF